jgi:hypothetical protein
MRRFIIFAIALCAPGVAGAQVDNNGQIDPLTDGVLLNQPCKPARATDRLRNVGPLNSRTVRDPKASGDWIADVEQPAEPDRQPGRIDMKADEQPQRGPAAGGELKLGTPPVKAKTCASGR